MPYTLNQIYKNPKLLTFQIPFEEETIILRPLENSDDRLLTTFLESLSPTTRRFSTYDSYDYQAAKQMCDDINKYDKLRFVTELEGKIVGLFEFSMDIVHEDIERFAKNGITLEKGKDCRFGPCIADELQGTGLASKVFPDIVEIAKKLGQESIILWGGVFANNERAIRYYERNGFKRVGNFVNKDGVECVDMIIHFK